MILSRTNVVLAAVLVLVLMLTVISRVDYASPNIEILPDMKYTPAFTSYAENPNFPNGRTLQAPVPGTIARGKLPWHYEATEADARRAGEQLQNPFRLATDSTDASTQNQAVTGPAEEWRQSVERGGAHYRVFCISCHGPAGAGDGPIPGRGFPPPPSMLTGKSLQMKDGQLFHIVTLGQGSMAGFAGQLAPTARWDVVNYVRSLQSSAPTAEPESVTEPTATEAVE